MENIRYIFEISIPVYLMFCLLYKIYRGKRKLSLRDYIFEFIFVVYILSVLVLFQILPINISDFKSMSITPSILPFLTILGGDGGGLRDIVIEILLNVVFFIPLGILYPLIAKRKKGIMKSITLISVIFSLFIEVMKYCTGRHFNIDNIIFNIIGAIVGYYIYRLVEKINFINFWITTFSGICILNLIDPFITLWIGEKYLLGFDVLIVLVLNYYQRMMRYSYSVFKEAAGIYYEDRFVPLIESVLNIIFSIILLKIFGLKGVFIGTLVSSLALWGFSYPKYVYKKLFNQNMKSYIFENIKYLIIFILLVILSIIKVFIFKFDSAFITLFINLIISIIIPNLIIILIFHKNEEFKYFIKLICKKLGVKNEK